MAVKRTRGRNLNVVLAERKARRRSRLRAVLFTVLALAGVVVVVRTWLEQRRTPAIEPYRLVVLPLENRTGDSAFDAVGLVASDWVTRVLSGYARQREVVPTTTTLAYLHSARLARYDLHTRALRLARGTRAQRLVWGTYYRTGDSLRFNVEIHDLKTSLMVGSVPQIGVPVDKVMDAVNRLQRSVLREVMASEWYNRPRPRPVPNLPAYEAFVSGLDDFVDRRYHQAATRFARASRQDTTSWLPHQIWLVDALFAARSFERADSAVRTLRGRRVTRADEARAMRAFARLRHELQDAYNWSFQLAAQNRADDIAQYDLALDALALGRAREARRIFNQLHPNHGALHGRPDFYLHHAAAYHLLREHQLELRVVRNGLMRRHRSLDVRLANCRVRAALPDEQDALAALNAIVARDTDTTSTLSVGQALDDCAAELGVHGKPLAASRAHAFSRQWHAQRPARSNPPVRDAMFEGPYIKLEQARASAEKGDAGGALTILYDAMSEGLPYYQPGRMMLHAEPAFRRLHGTRGFLQINQTRG